MMMMMNRWNSLSKEIVDRPSVNAFKRHLEHGVRIKESLRQKKITAWTLVLVRIPYTLLAAGYTR